MPPHLQQQRLGVFNQQEFFGVVLHLEFVEFVVIGLCSGADAAHPAACRDERIRGAAMIDGYGYQTPQFERHARRQLILRRLRKSTSLANWRAMLPSRLAARPAASSSDALKSLVKREFPARERIESEMPLVVKRDGTRAPYNRDNILGGVRKACEKRPIASDRIAALVDDVERAVLDRGEPEVPSTFIGERVMERLRELDDVAYVRFASVYRSFRDAEDFLTELKHFLDKSR